MDELGVQNDTTRGGNKRQRKFSQKQNLG